MGKKILLFIAFFIGINSVNAAICDNHLKVQYQEQAKNISYSYNYIDSNNAFDVVFNNVDDVFYFKNIDNEDTYDGANGEIKISNVKPGSKIGVKVFPDDGTTCSAYNVYYIYVNLPYYNPYYQDNLCNGIEDYKYCKKFLNKSVTYEEFINNIQKYRDSLNNEISKENDSDTLSLFMNVVDFYLKSYFIILPIIIVINIITIIVIKHKRKNELF